MQHQEQTNWCWAATAASVSRFFLATSNWTQCTVVNAELGRDDCCQNGSSSNCNVPWYLDRALQRTGNFVSMSPGSGNMSNIRQEIDNNRPLCIRVGWSGGGGHFLAIDGYNPGLSMVAVDDPWYGASDVSLSVLQTAYQGSGSWTHRYRVQP
ncbi:MAG: C39 family peptidase [Candidatus Bathyarchaeota archaeon]|nr:C39 family peptidase [Candidatus Bathyarchaeota archaeon]